MATTRRGVLRLGLGGLAASAWSAFGDEAKAGGTIFAHVEEMIVGGETIRGVLAIDPDQGTWTSVLKGAGPTARVSPDGRTIASIDLEEASVRLFELADGTSRKLVESKGDSVIHLHWAADGRSLIVSAKGEGTWKVSADGSGREKLPIGDEDEVIDWSLDGKILLVNSARDVPPEAKDAKVVQGVYAVTIDGKTWTLVSKSEGPTLCWRHRISPDGKAVVYLRASERAFLFRKGSETTVALWAVDVDGRNPRLFFDDRREDGPFEACWSPDGKRVAVVLFDRSRDSSGRKNDAIRGCDLAIADAQGKGAKTLNLPPSTVLTLLNWR